VDALRPQGVLALVTSHYTLDKQNAAIREYVADRADFVGAIRLPSDAFKREGTSVVTDIVFLRKRSSEGEACHVDPDWLGTTPLSIEGVEISVNRYFINHPDMVLGTWSRMDTLYGEGYSVVGTGELTPELAAAVSRLPEYTPISASPTKGERKVAFTPPPLLPHISEGSFVVGRDRTICQVESGESRPVTCGGKRLTTYGSITGRKLAALVGLRDLARRVLQSQNDAWPEANRNEARRELNSAYDRFVGVYGPINKTTFHETSVPGTKTCNELGIPGTLILGSVSACEVRRCEGASLER
jgi:hypothetical protein